MRREQHIGWGAMLPGAQHGDPGFDGPLDPSDAGHWRGSVSRSVHQERPASGSKYVAVCANSLANANIGKEVIIFALQPPVEPARKVTKSFDNSFLSLTRAFSTRRTVSINRNRHAIFVIIAATMIYDRADPVEISPLNVLEDVRDLMEFDVLGCMMTD